MRFVSDLMTEPVKVDKSNTLTHALDIMEKHDVRRLMVVHDDDVVGVLTLRGVMRVIGSRKTSTVSPSTLRVSSAMDERVVKVHPEMPVEEALSLLYRSGALVVADSEIKGWVIPKNVLKLPMPEVTADRIMVDPIAVSPGERVVHARRVMFDRDVGRLPVVEGTQLVGIVSEKDIVDSMRKFKLDEWSRSSMLRNLLVEDIMKRDVITVNEESPVEEVARVMLERDVGGVPVVDGENSLAGMIARRDIIKALIP